MLLVLALACAHRAPAPSPAPPPPDATPVDGAEGGEEAADWRSAIVPSLNLSGTEARLGASDARFTIVAYGDYLCPYCAGLWPQLKSFVADNVDVNIVVKAWPIDGSCNPAVEGERHRFACLAAKAAKCAGRADRFLEMADLLYLYPEHITPIEVPLFAEKLGLDKAAFAACLADPAIAAALAADIQSGVDAGLSGTPTLYVRGLVPEGWLEIPPKIDVLDAVLQTVREGNGLPR